MRIAKAGLLLIMLNGGSNFLCSVIRVVCCQQLFIISIRRQVGIHRL